MPKIVSDLECTFNSFALLQKILIFDGVFDGHGVKAGTVFRDPDLGTVGPGTPSKFKSGTSSPLFNDFIFSEFFC